MRPVTSTDCRQPVKLNRGSVIRAAGHLLREHSTYLFPGCALSARGISIATAKTSVNAGRHRRTYRQELWHKGGVGGALKEALHRRREGAPGGRRTCVPAELTESRRPPLAPDCPGNELFLTYFTALRLTVFVRRYIVLVRQRGKEKR
jgi:hypothetical protein